MRRFGWIYIGVFGLDALFSILALLFTPLETISNVISTPLGMVSVGVFILGCIGELRPRGLFLLLSGYYLFMLGIGIVLAVMLVIRLGPSTNPALASTAFLHEEFPWFVPIHWALILLMAAMTAISLFIYRVTPSEDISASPGYDLPPVPPKNPLADA